MNFGCLLMYSISKSKILKITCHLTKNYFPTHPTKVNKVLCRNYFLPWMAESICNIYSKKKKASKIIYHNIYQKDYLNSRMGNSPIWYFRSWKSKKVQSSCSILLLWLHPRKHGKIILHQNKEFAHSWFTFYFKFYILL